MKDKRKVEIDFLYLDLEQCTRCKGTEANANSDYRGTRLHNTGLLGVCSLAVGPNCSTRTNRVL